MDAPWRVQSLDPARQLGVHCFQGGLAAELGRNVSATSSSEVRDDLLRFYDDCPRYLARVSNNSSALHERHEYRRDAYPSIRRRLARVLAIDELTISDGSFFLFLSLHLPKLDVVFVTSSLYIIRPYLNIIV